MPEEAQENRRRYARKELKEEVYCYVAGERLDANTSDISLGGMFVETDQAEMVEIGEIVGLVFQSWPGQEHPIYLFGHAVRRQMEPIPGVGIHWETAATLSSPGKLNDFFRQLFGIEGVQVRMETAGPGGQMRSVYVFPEAETGQTPVFPEDNKEGSEEPKPLTSGTAPAYVSAGERLQHSKRPGAMTGMIRRRELETNVSIEARIHLIKEMRKFQVEIRRMDANGLFVATPSAARQAGGPVAIELKIRVQAGLIPVTCHCAVEKTEDGSGALPSGLHLIIRKLDEGRHKGIYGRYLKWLHFRTLSGK